MSGKNIRKSIDIPHSVVVKIKRLAREDKRPVKLYLEKIVLDHVACAEQKKPEDAI